MHHLIRRKATLEDTGLNDSKNIKNHIWTLPLSHEGIFGPGLEQKLKERVEINKQISDLLPEVDRKGKRKQLSSSDQSWKRPKFSDDRQQSFKPYQQKYSGTSRQQYRPGATGSTYPRFPKSTGTKSAAVGSSFRNKFGTK